MNDKIKEILDKLGKKSSIYKFQINQGTSFNTDEYEASILLDYITNLQEENERLRNQLQQKENIIKGLDNTIENLNEVLQQKENIIKDIKAQLEYLETYSSKEDVFEDMKRRLDRIEKIIGENNDK